MFCSHLVPWGYLEDRSHAQGEVKRLFKKGAWRQARARTHVIPVLLRLRQEENEFKFSLGYLHRETLTHRQERMDPL